MSASTINIAPASALAISNVRCSGPKKKRITCGTTRPTKPIEPAMLTMVAVISAAVVKRIRRTRGTAIPSEAAASSPKVMHIADARYQTIAAICDAVSNTLTAEPSRFTAAMDKVILNRFLGLPIFLFVMYLMFLLAINIGGALQPIFDAGSVAIFVHGIQWLGYTLHFQIGRAHV